MEWKLARRTPTGAGTPRRGRVGDQDAARPSAGARTLTHAGSSGRSMRTMPYNHAAGRISTHAMARTKTRSTGASVRWSGCRAVGPSRALLTRNGDPYMRIFSLAAIAIVACAHQSANPPEPAAAATAELAAVATTDPATPAKAEPA